MIVHGQHPRTSISLVMLLLVLMVCPLPRVQSHTHAEDSLAPNGDIELALHLYYSHNNTPIDPSEPHDHWHLDPTDASVAIPSNKVDLDPIVIGPQLCIWTIEFAQDDFAIVSPVSLNAQLRRMNFQHKASSLTGLAHQAFLGTFLF